MKSTKAIGLIKLFLLASVIARAASGASVHIDSRTLFKLEVLSSRKIGDQGDATDYVRKAAVVCGAENPALLPDGVESRLAEAELNAAKDPPKLISDDQVANAFNFMSDQFGVANPIRLTGADVLHYRGVMSAIFPHVFSPETVAGNRPIGAVVMLYLLVSYGGMTEGWKKVGGPNSFVIADAEPTGHPGIDRNALAWQYHTASLAYFQRSKPEEIQLFIGRLAKIMALPI